MRAPDLREPGRADPTKDERRLLRALAAALAGSGFVLPALARPSIPVPALRVALMHGLALDEVEVAWLGAPGR